MENGPVTAAPPRAGETGSTVTIGADLAVGRVGYGAMRLTGSQVWGDYPDRDDGIAPAAGRGGRRDHVHRYR